MRNSTARRANRRFILDIAAVVVALIACASVAGASTPESTIAAQATAPDVTARSFSVEGFKSGDKARPGKSQIRSLPQTKSRVPIARSVDTGFYVYDAIAEVYFDDDGDGFFYGLDVYFDVDTDFVSANVYAALYLSRDGGPWQLYYTTANFRIDGAIADDEYLVETELFEGYPTDYYDVLIEVYDADFGDLVAEYGPGDTSGLAFLPLEDQLKDTPVFVGDGFVVVDGGGGATGLGLLALALLALRRRARGRA